MPEAMGLFDALYTTRSIRRFTAEPVSDSVLRRVLGAAGQAPSGGNRQPWTWLVLRDPGRKRRLRELLVEGHARQGREAAGRPLPPHTYTEDLAHVGAVVLVCSRRGGNAAVATFPAIQNLLLAARALGLGGNITLGFQWNEEAIMREFGIPDDQAMAAVVPLGYPAGTPGERHGTKNRKSVEEVTFLDHWGRALPGQL